MIKGLTVLVLCKASKNLFIKEGAIRQTFIHQFHLADSEIIKHFKCARSLT